MKIKLILLCAILIISKNICALPLSNDPSQNGQRFDYSPMVTPNDAFQNRNFGYGNQQAPFDLRGSSGTAPPTDLASVIQQALNSFSSISQEVQNTNLPVFSYSVTNAGTNSRVVAKSSIRLQNQHRSLSGNAVGLPSLPFALPSNGLNLGLPSLPMLPNFNGQSGAATASLLPSAILQSAGIFPPNPMLSNIFNRMSPAAPQGNGYGVYTSSQSGNYNPNGMPRTFNEASSTVNDNGNVTSYTVYHQ